MYRQKLHSVQLTVTFYFNIDFEEESIHVFLSRSSWTIFGACQVCGLKPSFRKSSRGQRIFITWQNTPSTVAPEIPRIPPLNNRPSFWYWYTLTKTQGQAEHKSEQLMTSYSQPWQQKRGHEGPTENRFAQEDGEVHEERPWGVPLDKVFLLNSPWPATPLPPSGPTGHRLPDTACFTKLIPLVLHQRWRENNNHPPPHIQATGTRKCAKSVCVTIQCSWLIT